MNEDIKKDITIDDILNYYGHNFYCPNCHTRNSRHIRKGVKIKDVRVVCDHCGCTIPEQW